MATKSPTVIMGISQIVTSSGIKYPTLPVILSEAKNLSRSGRTSKRQRPFATLRVTTENKVVVCV